VTAPAAAGSASRVGAVDIGTNTTRLLVADVINGHVDDVVRLEVITRLGEGVDSSGRLLPAAVARVHDVLARYRREVEELGATRTLAVATSAVRDAENGEAFLREVEEAYRFATRLLAGREEAELVFRGVMVGRDLEGETLVVDVGGGSTELVLGSQDGLESATSLQLGSVRLTERFFASDPPASDELVALRNRVRATLPVLSARHAIGVSGTVTTLAALDLGLDAYDAATVDGHRLSRGSVERLLARLAALPLAERRRLPALDPERAPVIVAGTAIVAELLPAYDLAELETSVRDILDGAALAAAELPPLDETDAPARADTRR
jgi:exopolyphosphatase / guanosine-5'-triphosphate,3'-diphosphate pyrophosphatase